MKWVPTCTRHCGDSAAEAMEPCWEAHHLGYKWAESQKEVGSPPPQGLGDSQGTCRHSVDTF